jgi:hypothetical protein
MTPAPRQLFQAYINRRSPWGPPWWVYGVTFGVANLIRQVAIMLSAAEVSSPARVASWVATVLLTVALVNTVAFALRRLTSRRHVDAAPPPEIAQLITAPPEHPAEEAA